MNIHRHFLSVFSVAALMNAVVADAKLISPEMCLSYRVVDDEGSPVSDVSCRGWIREFDAKGGGHSYFLKSDTNGLVTISGRCSVSFTAFFTKEGYYMSRLEPCLDADGTGSAIVDGRWQPYGETRTVVLKRIRNPWAVKVFSDEQCHRKIPAFDQWLPFDMEKSDWLAPYGNGVFNDVLLRFGKKETDKWYVYTFSMEACFTNNPYAGFYITTLDEFSDLKTDYFANTNVVYQTNYAFLKECIERQPVKITGLGTDQYLVFRTRTRVDEDGNLIGAHYGKISRGWYSNGKEMHHGGGCFNPVENDLNIEGDQTLLDAIKNYKKK